MKKYIVWSFCAFVLSGCQSFSEIIDYSHYGNRIAAESGFTKEYVKTDSFTITTYKKINNSGEPITFYIEGDGLSWISKTRISRDPTPKDPIGLKLALNDDSDNVIYVARPCQFSTYMDSLCKDNSYWTNKRFSEEVVASLNQAITKLTLRYQVKGVHLVGYSGGGAVAVLIAARRYDVLSLRTVAGNLDHMALNNYHNVSQMPESLNPIDVVAQIKGLPQYHFLGAEDEIVPGFIVDGFVEAVGDDSCVQTAVLDGVGHKKGWVAQWADLLKKPIVCD